MPAITAEDIKESNRIKKEKCRELKEAMKSTLTEEQLEQLEEVFYSVAEEYLFKRKEN